MHAAEKYHLIVSGLGGTVYIAKLTKTPYIMSEDRRKVPLPEFISAILQYTLSQIKEKDDTMSITIDGKVVAEVVIKDRKAITGK